MKMDVSISCLTRYLSMAVAVLFSLFSPTTAAAEDLGIIRVESTTIDDRFESKREEPSNIAVIGGDKVDEAHSENIQQLLQSIPGITTEVQSGDSLKIHIRGVENQRYMGEKPGVAIVIDGVPVFERTGRVNIDLDNIESIKVIKGGASYLFGEDALSGAVIITTKRGAKMAGFKVAGEAGSYGYQKELARAGFSTEKANGHIQGTIRESDGYHDQSDYKANYVNGKVQYYVTDSSDLTFAFEVSDRAKDSHGTVRGVTQATDDPKSESDEAGRDYARMYDVGLSKYYLTYAHDIGDASNLMMNVYHFGDDTKFSSAPQKYDAQGKPVIDRDAYTTGNDYKQVQRGFKSEWRSGGEKVAYMAAVDLRRNTYDNKTRYLVDFKRSPRSRQVYKAGTVTSDNETGEEVYAAYGELKVKVANPLTLTLNARYDQLKLDYQDRLNDLGLDKTFNVDSWRVGANYKASDNWDIYANASTGFRTPTVSQLFAGKISPFGDTESNPDLAPERSINYEIGTRGKGTIAGVGVEVDVAVFQIDRKDFILNAAGQYAVPGEGVKDRFENIGGVRNRGMELTVNTDRAKMVSFDLAYTYLDAEFTEYDNFNLVLGNRYSNPTVVPYNNTGNVVPRTPNHHVNLTGTVKPLNGLSISLEMDAISSYYADEINLVKIPGHEVFNLLASYDIRRAKSNWSFFLRVDNVFDRDYYNTARGFYDQDGNKVYDDEDISIVVNPGRVFTAGASVTF